MYKKLWYHFSIPALRRAQADLIDTYKFVYSHYKTPADHFFTQGTGLTRGHEKKLFKTHSRTEIHKHFFSQRVIDNWNKLPEDVVNAKSVNSFKKKLSTLPIK